MRNGNKKNGSQNLLCNGCRKQFQAAYVYAGCVASNKGTVLKMLSRGSGVWDAAAVSGMSKSTLLSLIKTTATGLVIRPQKHAYHRVQIDEQWPYVGKKQKKVWLLCAYAAEEGEIIAITIGGSKAPQPLKTYG